MTCIKTGADVLINAHGATLHGDLFLINDVYILALGGPITKCWGHNPQHYHITAYSYEELGSRAIAFDKQAAGLFNYDGWSRA